jgi:hypothetical protein
VLRLFGLFGAAMGVTLFMHAPQGTDNFRRGELMSFVAADASACILLLQYALQGAIGWPGYVLMLTYLSSFALFGYVLLMMRRVTRN